MVVLTDNTAELPNLYNWINQFFPVKEREGEGGVFHEDRACASLLGNMCHELMPTIKCKHL